MVAASGLPRRIAHALLAAATGRPREWLIAHDDAAVPAPARRRFAALLARHRAGEPLAYLMGWVEFHGHRLTVTPAVLIPRPETEALVNAALARVADATTPRLLDLGSGSGAIAVALALARPEASVVAVERSAAALAVARSNARHLGARIRWRRGDWFDALTGHDGPFDAIVANPPYLAADDPHLPDLRHEPQAALVAGADGLEALREIAAAAPARLTPGGWLLVEHGWTQGAAVRALLRAVGFAAVATLHDAAGHERIGVARRAGGGCA